MQYFGYIILSLVILLVMVLIHELGHYTAAKILGFTVEEFSVGFGPKLLSKRRKNGELFSLRAFPLGGYCAFLGENEETPEEKNNADNKTENSAANPKSDGASVEKNEINVAPENGNEQGKDEDLLSYVMRVDLEEKETREKKEKEAALAAEPAPVRLDKNGNPAKTFNQQPPWKRIIVLLGGVVFNFLSAIIFSIIYIGAVGYPVTTIHEVTLDPSGVAYSALQKDDVILGVNGKDINVMDDFSSLTASVKEGQTVTFKVDRNGKIISVDATKKKIITTGDDGKTTEYVGFGFTSGTAYRGANAGNAFKYCVPYTFKLSWSILGSFGGLITGQVPITSVTGPVGSIKLMADVSAMNWRNILILLPLLASNLAIFNLIPFPGLDGAQIVFTIIEWIRRKPIKREIQGAINGIGIIVLLLFVVIIDILSFAL